ncbi:MAG: hypothetical protein PVS2B3_02110 [Steroidobacteraceae bacterium]
MAPVARLTVAIGAGLLLAGCATSSHVLVGTARPPISPDQVKVYMQPPAKYEQIATVDATSRGSLTLTSQQNMDKAIARLKQEAARLGANGILLQGIEDQQSGSIGTGVGNSTFNGNTAIGASLGGSFGIYNKAAKGLAIYVP